MVHPKHRKRGAASRTSLLVAAVFAVLFLSSAATTMAFSPEILQQVIVQLSSPEAFQQVITQLGSADPFQVNDLAFAAANLLDDSMSPTRQNNSLQKIPLLQPPNVISGGSIKLPKLAPSVYDYETERDETTRTIQGSLDLTPQEEALIQLLRKVREECSPRTTIRIAGGWVRDKLIYGKNTPSRDIDLVLSDVSGKEFADKLCKYVESTSQENVIVRDQSSSSKGVKADRLETASLFISGFDLDFTRLRYEKYDKDSRIPSNVGVASAVVDAWRRDLTINSLYYNINTNQVEDWTERGVIDLILQNIATPKKPLPTLLEDPTRILRAIRFAAQLSFDVSPALIRAARDNRVRNALQYKVSRDVIGEAIDQMLGTRARDPCRGIQLLMATDLMDVVFPLEIQDDGADSRAIYKIGLECLSRTQSLVTRIFLKSPDLDWDISKRRLLWYAALFKPVYEMSSVGGASKRGRRQGSPFYKLFDALKRPKADVQLIESILKGVDPLQTKILEGSNGEAIQSAIRSDARLEDLSPQNSKWEELSELRWILYSALKPIGIMWKEALILALASSQKSMDDCVNQYIEMISFVEDNLLLGTILRDKDKPRPLLNGSQIQSALGGQIDGRGFKRVVQSVEEWQIRNVWRDLDRIDDDERGRAEAQLVNFLVGAFPEYVEASQSLER